MFISVAFRASDCIAIDISGRHKVLSYTLSLVRAEEELKGWHCTSPVYHRTVFTVTAERL